jgi:hypothetical protein
MPSGVELQVRVAGGTGSLQLAMSPVRYRFPPYSPPVVWAKGFWIDW